MSIDPDPIAERGRTISRSELKMQDRQSIEETAEIGDELAEEFNL